MVACLRHADLQPALDPVTGAVRPHAQAATAAPAEWAALEIALRVAQAWGGRVLAVTAGPPDAETVLREALAVGAEALRVQWPSGHGAGGAGAGGAGAAYPAGMVHLDGEAYLAELAGDEQPLAAALAAAVRPLGPALVVCGDRSGDRGTGALPAFLAHELGAAQALGLVSLAADGDQLLAERQLLTKRGLLAERQLLAERRLPAGRRERLRVRVPAVCSVEAAGIRLRRAPLPAVLAARTAVIPVVTPGPAAQPVRAGVPRPYSPRTHEVPGVPAGSARERLFALSAVLTRREPPVVVSPASADAAADALLGYLHRAGYALPVDPGTAAGPAFARNPALAGNPGPAAEPGPAADPDPAAGPGRKAGQP